ncbi:MAG: hypothetical protein R2879_07750 [Saprospiraceae bacterium]
MKLHFKGHFLLIFLLFCLNSNMAFAQQSYLEYHRQFSIIERLIVDEKFIEAESEIDSLFQSYDVKFSKDYVIAAQICLLNGNKEKATDLLIKSFRNGIKSKCLRTIPICKEKFEDEIWAKLEKAENEKKKEYLKNLDLKLHKEFHTRYQTEQDAKGSQHYRAIVQSNFDRIKDLISENKSIGEASIGLDNQKFASSIADCSLGNSKVIVTLLHYDYPVSELGIENLITEIKKGNLHPREFASIYTFEINKVSKLYKNSNKVYPPLPHYDFNFPFGKKSEELKKVNQDRALFGICPYETDLKKEAICKKYGLKLEFGYR